jgi:hypothetical protein
MPLDRLPRKFLTAWVHGPRGKKQSKLHYGTHITKCLKNIGVFDDWYTRAQDRDDWRAVVRGIKLSSTHLNENISSSPPNRYPSPNRAFKRERLLLSPAQLRISMEG